jgi:hypothetical protein
MSDSFAIATVTAAMAYLLESEGVTVTTNPPDLSGNEEARINIFLYQVTPNLGYRNIDTPARSYSGELVSKQQLGLDLHYLLTAYGKSDDELSSQKVLAQTMRVLHENPILTRDLITQALADSTIADLPDMDSANLADQVEIVKLTMQSLSLEDLTKIWSSFFKTGSYRISVAYKATAVLLDGKMQPRSTMPVRKVNSYVNPMRAPEITYIEPQMLPWTSGGMEIKIVGRNLKADVVKIDFGEGLEPDDMPDPIPPAPNKEISPDEIAVAIPDTVAPGIKQVRVVHPLSIGTPETLHKGPESNVGLFAVVPVITDIPVTSVARGAKLTVKFEPAINRDQQTQVIISTNKPLPIEWPASNPATTNTVQVTIPSDYALNKDLPVRLRVDGAESQPDELELKWHNKFKRPVVKIT